MNSLFFLLSAFFLGCIVLVVANPNAPPPSNHLSAPKNPCDSLSDLCILPSYYSGWVANFKYASLDPGERDFFAAQFKELTNEESLPDWFGPYTVWYIMARYDGDSYFDPMSIYWSHLQGNVRVTLMEAPAGAEINTLSFKDLTVYNYFDYNYDNGILASLDEDSNLGNQDWYESTTSSSYDTVVVVCFAADHPTTFGFTYDHDD